MAFESFWWAKHGHDHALSTGPQTRLLAAAAARLPGSAGDGGAGMSSADAKGHPVRSRSSDDNQPPDAPLVERLRTGDADAFAEIVRAWSPKGGVTLPVSEIRSRKVDPSGASALPVRSGACHPLALVFSTLFADAACDVRRIGPVLEVAAAGSGQRGV